MTSDYGLDGRAFADRYFDMWNQRAFDRALEFFAFDVSYRDEALGKTFEGLPSLLGFMRAIFEGAPDVTYATVDVVQQGDSKLAVQWLSKRTASGNTVSTMGMSLIEVRDHKVQRCIDYYHY